MPENPEDRTRRLLAGILTGQPVTFEEYAGRFGPRPEPRTFNLGQQFRPTGLDQLRDLSRTVVRETPRVASAVSRGVLDFGREIGADPSRAYWDLLQGAGAGAVSGLLRFPEMVGAPVGGLREGAQGLIPESIVGRVGGAVGQIGPEFTPAGDIAAIPDALRDLAEGRPGMAALSAASVLPLVPNVGKAVGVGGYFSRVKEAVQKGPGKASGDEWLRFLNPAKRNFASGEAEYTGLTDFLRSKGSEKVTQAEVAEFMEGSGIRLTETVRPLHRDVAPLPTKFEQYTQPGGENYQEILIQLDLSPKESFEDFKAGYLRLYPNTRADDNMIREYWEAGSELPSRAGLPAPTSEFTSGHWDEPNVLAHLRTKDRTWRNPETGQDEKVLFIEEIQSDWHQKGREKGYRGRGEKPFPVDDLTVKAPGEHTLGQEAMGSNEVWAARLPEPIGGREVFFGLSRDEAVGSARAHWEGLSTSSSVPDAPFKKTDEWVGLAVRRAIDEATAGGYDRIAWASGDQAADLYDLRKQVSRVEYEEAQGVLRAFDEHGNEVINQGGVNPNDLGDYIGKEPANRLLSREPSSRISADNVADYRDLRAGDLTQEQMLTLSDIAHQMNRDKLPWDEVTRGFRDPAESDFDPDFADFLESVEFDIEDGPLRQATSKIRAIEGEDLSVGGEGMKEFYDRIVPKAVQKEMKAFGGGRAEPFSLEFSEVVRIEPQPGGGWVVTDEKTGFDGFYETRGHAEEVARSIGWKPVSEEPTNLSIPISKPAAEKVRSKGLKLFGTAALAGAGAKAAQRKREGG
jgi:hypothetical protein